MSVFSQKPILTFASLFIRELMAPPFIVMSPPAERSALNTVPSILSDLPALTEKPSITLPLMYISPKKSMLPTEISRSDFTVTVSSTLNAETMYLPSAVISVFLPTVMFGIFPGSGMMALPKMFTPGSPGVGCFISAMMSPLCMGTIRFSSRKSATPNSSCCGFGTRFFS